MSVIGKDLTRIKSTFRPGTAFFCLPGFVIALTALALGKKEGCYK